MGKFDFEVDVDFLKSLGRLGEVEQYAPQMIDEAMPILEVNVKREVGKHRKTGDLADSIKRQKARKASKGGFYAFAFATGTDRNGIRNGDKLAWLEYGVKGKFDPTPIVTKALNDSESEVLEKMQAVFEREAMK